MVSSSWKRAEKFILEVGKFEDRIFKKRSELKGLMLEKIAADNEIPDLSSTLNGSALTAEDQVLKNTMDLKEKLRASIRKKSDVFRNCSLVSDKVTYYPYRYGPFASDLKGLLQVEVMFEQLMAAVLPPRSGPALPKPYQTLMTDASRISSTSTLPGISVLPFVDEQRLLAEVNKVEKELEAHELERNKHNTERLYIKEGTSIFVELP
ncbi:5'-3' exoribonuclease 2 [Linum grandiflorum]